LLSQPPCLTLGYKQKAVISLSNKVWKNFLNVTYLHSRSDSFKRWVGSAVAQVQALPLPMNVTPGARVLLPRDNAHKFRPFAGVYVNR